MEFNDCQQNFCNGGVQCPHSQAARHNAKNRTVNK